MAKYYALTNDHKFLLLNTHNNQLEIYEEKKDAMRGERGSDERVIEVFVMSQDKHDCIENLVTEWELEADFLSFPQDDITDKVAGKVFRQCANELRKVLLGHL